MINCLHLKRKEKPATFLLSRLLPLLDISSSKSEFSSDKKQNSGFTVKTSDYYWLFSYN